MASKLVQGLENEDAELIPGLPNDISIGIGAKMTWPSLYTMANVSVAWRAAIRSRRVYDARVASNSRRTLLVMSYLYLAKFPRLEPAIAHRITLYSIDDGGVLHLRLPPVLNHGRRRAHHHLLNENGNRCVSLDGKIYLLAPLPREATVSMFVLEVAAAHGEWQPCATMQTPGCERLQSPRLPGICTALGKIYVLGDENFICSAPNPEVYDPLVDRWTSLVGIHWERPRLGGILFGSTEFTGNVVGDEIFWCNVVRHKNLWFRDSEAFTVYQIGNKAWRTVDVLPPFLPTAPNMITAVKGKLHRLIFTERHRFGDGLIPAKVQVFDIFTRMWSSEIEVYDFPTKGWGHSVAYVLEDHTPFAIVAVRDQLWGLFRDGTHTAHGNAAILNGRHVFWETKFSLFHLIPDSVHMSTIEL